MGDLALGANAVKARRSLNKFLLWRRPSYASHLSQWWLW